jgi:selenide,water dikinase
LDLVLGKLPRLKNENVLIGFDTSDDAGVYKLTEKLALVQTVDFFTPIVDDPYLYGQIAAANSLSDVYAMGGRPISALSIVAFPAKGDPEVLGEIMRGGAEKIMEADCALIGGHSIADDEIKFGYAVTGAIDPGRILANAGARAGDVLVLTKRIGTGVISTALKRGTARAEHVDGAVESMRTLNRKACEAMLRHPSHGCTDITGFGLLGHAREMAKASGVTIYIDSTQLEFLPGAVEYSAQGAIPGGLKNNREFVSCAVRLEGAIAPEVENLLYDPQTSGGLLISVARESGEALVEDLRANGVTARVLGEVGAYEGFRIVVR